MLKILRLRAENFCQHASLDVEFKAGITSLTGVNGAGKSNLVRALFFGLTGEVAGAETKDDMIKWGAREGSVALDLTDGVEEFCVERTLHNGKHSLKSKRYGDMTRKAEINNLLSSLIGLDVKLLSQVVFVPQGRLDALLVADHAERVRTFNKLFGLDAAERLRGVLQDFKARVVNHPSREADIQELEAREAECAKTLDEASREKADVTKSLEGLLAQRPMFESALHAPSLEEGETELVEKEEALARAREEWTTIERELETLPVEPPELTQREQRIARELANLPLAREQMAATEGSMEAMRRQEPVAPAPPFSRTDLDDVSAKVSDLERRKKLCDAGRCESCGQDYVLSDEHKAELEASLRELSKRKSDMEAAWEEHEAYLRGYELEWKAWSEGLQYASAQHNTLAKQVDAAEKAAEGFDLEDYRRREALLDLFHESAPRRNELNARGGELRGLMGRLEAEKAVALEQRGHAVTAEIKRNVSEILGRMDEFERRRSRLEVDEARLTETLRGVRERLEIYKAEEAVRETNASAVSVIDRSREVLHPDMLPKLAARKAVECFNQLIGRYLELFHTNFNVSLSGDMDFRCGFVGKEDAPISALSGGQRIVAALASRFALMEMLTYGCGLLVLDEPTAHLDVDNKRALLDVLKEAAAHVKAHGITVLIPTHEDLVSTASTDALTI